MPISYIYNRMIREEIKNLIKPVTLKIFTSSKNLQESVKMMDVMDIYQKSSNDMLKIEEYKLETNSDLVKKYEIQQAPTILMTNAKDQVIIRYLAIPTAAKIQPFVQSLMVLTGTPNYYENIIRENLNKINPTVIKVLISDYCAYCSSVISICSLFALASEGKMETVIIDIMAYPEISEQYNVTTVPTLIINEDKKLIGDITADELLNELINKTL
ncbi:MAG: thioredoxin family protein [Candidatus Lokiarchaeota archaeon]|nr:thioredoxin family protein [Candidatus Lokiarchaeota archaeon]